MEIHQYNKDFPEDNKTRVLAINADGSINTSSGTQSSEDGTRDSFGRLRVAQISSQLDLKQIHDDLPLFYDTQTIGTGSSTYTNATASSLLETSANLDVVIKQTFQKANYQSGKGQQILMTFAGFQPETNIEKKVGYFSSSTTTPFSANEDGIYLASYNGVIGFFTIREGTITNSAFQSQWDDPMNGTGASGITLDFSKAQIMELTYEWLGVGSVVLRFVVDGMYYQAHIFKNANSVSDVYMASPNQPLRYQIRQSGAGSGSFKQICATVGSEGSINEIGIIQSQDLGSTFVNANSTANTYALLGLKLQEDKTDAAIDILDFNILALTSSNLLWKVLLNPTVAGTFNYTDVSNSVMMKATGDVAGSPSATTVTGGTKLASGYVGSGTGSSSISANASIVNALRLGMSIAGVQDEIVLCVQPLDANADVTASINWRERT